MASKNIQGVNDLEVVEFTEQDKDRSGARNRHLNNQKEQRGARSTLNYLLERKKRDDSKDKKNKKKGKTGSKPLTQEEQKRTRGTLKNLGKKSHQKLPKDSNA